MALSVSSITLKEFDILWAVRELGDTAHFGAIQQKIEQIHVPQHKQNFRRTVEALAVHGLLEFLPCRIRTGGRPARVRARLTNVGRAHLREFAIAISAALTRYSKEG